MPLHVIDIVIRLLSYVTIKFKYSRDRDCRRFGFHDAVVNGIGCKPACRQFIPFIAGHIARWPDHRDCRVGPTGYAGIVPGNIQQDPGADVFRVPDDFIDAYRRENFGFPGPAVHF